ncbi:MGMT family protein [Myxococcus sp. MISCRS1]|jgi:methylated-DNA-protein-cysteine methyltransferase-like protein|uniref:MGMT family protein n=1 Tax=Myxococcus TaxID=32 RepID=UPI001CBB0394|nr:MULTISPECIES: MGMT family protein [unclassified Myxococcus]MBZ4398156.1 MGMT family protein [Myxococcus sp. AS-1-15]MCY1003323.1 MGMT family protein [Myxococcus sp. MISCRS1]BDT35074.1 MGMT family protein [Myxococcus sp. MH1]
MTQPARDERDYFERIYTVVQAVPSGKVATYGDIATIVGDGCDARVVGHALGALGARSATVPWQRIINRTGGISLTGHGQKELLEAEGVGFDERGQARMDLHHWSGPSEDWARARGFQPLPAPTAKPAAAQLSLF